MHYDTSGLQLSFTLLQKLQKSVCKAVIKS